MTGISSRTPVRRAIVLGALAMSMASALFDWGWAATPTARPAPAALQSRMIDNLAAGRNAAAVKGADSLAAAMRARYRDKPLAEAGFLDTLALRFINAGTHESWEAARRFASRALALRERMLGPDNLEAAGSLSMLALIDDFEGRWAEALPLEQRALAIRLRIHGEQHQAVALSLRQIGLYLYQLGRYSEAQPMLARSLAIYDSLGGHQEQRIVDALNNLGEVCRAQDRYDRALAYFERGLALAGARLRPGDPHTRAIRSNLARLYKDMGRYDDAEPLLVAHLEELRRSPRSDREILAAAYLDLADVYRLQGRIAAAAPLHAQALSIARGVFPADSHELAPFVAQAAVAFQQLGRLDLAEPLRRERLGLVERMLRADHPLVARGLYDLGVLLMERGQLGEAADTLSRALAIRLRALGEAHPDVAATRVALARCLSLDLARGDSLAAPLLERAIAVLDRSAANPEARLDAHALRAQLWARAGRMDEAIGELSQALALVDTLCSTGRAGQSRGSPTARDRRLDHQMVAWRVGRGDVNGALDTHERARARILFDRLVAASVNMRAGIPAQVLAPLERSEHDAREGLARAQRRMDETTARDDLTERARMEAGAALEATRDSAAWDLRSAEHMIDEQSRWWLEVLNVRGHVASLPEIQREALGPGEQMLLYHVGDDGSFLFVIPAGTAKPAVYALTLDSTAARELGVPAGPLTSERLERIIAGEAKPTSEGALTAVAALLRAHGDEPRARVTGQAQSLERRLAALWGSLVPGAAWKQVQAARTVVVVPDGALHLLPFEALVTRLDTGRGDTRYWLDDGPPVRYASSATSLVSLARRITPNAARPIRPQVLSVSNPDYARAESAEVARGALHDARWPSLPETARETEAIRRAFAPDSIAVCQGAAATEARVRAALPGRRFLHLGTHGYVTHQQGDELAGLALAPSDSLGDSLAGSSGLRRDDDGYLELDEIYDLSLDCHLAVLSRCGADPAPRTSDEGVFALARGLMAIGARRAVISMWEVGGESTTRLVGDLFAAVAASTRAGREPRYAEALRDAKRRMRGDPRWADPFYWSPFVLPGLP